MVWLYVCRVNGVEVLEKAVKIASLALFGLLCILIVAIFNLVWF